MLRSQDDSTSRKRARDKVSTMSLQDRIDRTQSSLPHLSDDYYDSSRVLTDLRIGPEDRAVAFYKTLRFLYGANPRLT